MVNKKLLPALILATLINFQASSIYAFNAADRKSVLYGTQFYDPNDAAQACTIDPTADTSGATITLPQSSITTFNRQKPKIDALKSTYQAVGESEGVPWEVLAAIHYREAGNDPNRSPLAGEPFGTPNPDHPEITVDNIEEGIKYQAEFVKSLVKGVYGVNVKPQGMSFEDLQKTFLAYNRGSRYNGYQGMPVLSPDVSPYVMNGYDAQHMRMRWNPPQDTVSGVDANLGAMTIFAALTGLAGTNCSNTGGGFGIDANGFYFPLRTTQAIIKKGMEGAVWCFNSQTSCHHDYKAADIFAPIGTIVLAAKSGKVFKAVDTSCQGGYDVPRVTVLAEDGNYYYYTHMKPGSIQVRNGQEVKAGQPLGVVGPSACAQGTPPHLHIHISTGIVYSTESPTDRAKMLDPQPPLVSSFNNLPEN